MLVALRPQPDFEYRSMRGSRAWRPGCRTGIWLLPQVSNTTRNCRSSSWSVCLFTDVAWIAHSHQMKQVMRHPWIFVGLVSACHAPSDAERFTKMFDLPICLTAKIGGNPSIIKETGMLGGFSYGVEAFGDRSCLDQLREDFERRAHVKCGKESSCQGKIGRKWMSIHDQGNRMMVRIIINGAGGN